MLVRYLPVIFLLTALVLALAPLEAAGQTQAPAPNAADNSAAQANASHKTDKPRPKTGAAASANADAQKVRPAGAIPPERIAPPQPPAPSRGGVLTPDPATASPARKDDPRSVEERPDPGG
jgi:hypothetical protein